MNTRKLIQELTILFLLLTLIPIGVSAKKKKDKKVKPVYVFKIEKEIPYTPVKNQDRTGTCWIFSTISFLESEFKRTSKEDVDLSEMFIARQAYPQKALRYIRMHGYANFGPGGQSHDVIDQMRSSGIVPEAVYDGKKIGEKRHNHGELSAILNGMLDGILKRRGKKITPRWREAFDAVLDIYLGEVPETFTYKGKEYTPKSFLSDYLKLNLDDYIELTSYSHYPFNQKCRLDIPDNWTYNSNYYNVRIDDLESIVDEAIAKGYSVCWDADVSDQGFSPKGKEELDLYDRPEYAIVPEKDWDDWTKAEKDEKFTHPIKEKEITQEMRQEAFDSFFSTDDHLLHLVGIAKDQTGAKFYKVKNSWGTDRRYKGFVYVSRSYFRLHTVNIMVNRHALPDKIKADLHL